MLSAINIDNPNLALNKPAKQSSTSRWSSSTDVSIDARLANNGDVISEIFFHTNKEVNPWWQVDLQQHFKISRIEIYNRKDNRYRLKKFSLLRSNDEKCWFPFFSKTDESIFGEDNSPYIATPSKECVARYIRLQLDGDDCLHFKECQIFGESVDFSFSQEIIKADQLEWRTMNDIPDERDGYLKQIGDFWVFVDNNLYSDAIVASINQGYYESRERNLVQNCLVPGDSVIELGSAIGVLTMTAASIVGAQNIITFDANPDIVADARRNFARNKLSAILSNVGMMKSRKGGFIPNETVKFFIDRAFWASRLNASIEDPNIIRVVKIPVFCLEDEIAARRANVLICDIEGGEVDLLKDADLRGIRLIIMETHYWSAGEAETNAMIRKLIVDGFSIHLGLSGGHVSVLRRETT